MTGPEPSLKLVGLGVSPGLASGNATLDTELFRDRAYDIADLRRRLLSSLTGVGAHALENVPPGSVLVATHLLPSDTVCLSRRSVVAVVVEAGGPCQGATQRGNVNRGIERSGFASWRRSGGPASSRRAGTTP